MVEEEGTGQNEKRRVNTWFGMVAITAARERKGRYE
jgi:hypothetical protein